jgi:hypothetical protein
MYGRHVLSRGSRKRASAVAKRAGDGRGYAQDRADALPPATPRRANALADGEAGLGVVVDDEARDCGLAMEVLGDGSLVAVGQRGGILAGRTTVSCREAAEHPLVGLDTDASLRRWIDDHLGPHAAMARYGPPSPTCASSSPAVARYGPPSPTCASS